MWNELYSGFKKQDCVNCYKQISSFNNHKVISFPQPIPYIGPDFHKNLYGLVFVGIESYNNEVRHKLEMTRYYPFESIEDNPEQASSEYIKQLFYGKANPKSQFWKWVKYISEEILGKENAFRQIAWTNLLKCQCRKGITLDSDKFEAHQDLIENCIRELGYIFREIQKIKAKNIIVFSGRRDNSILARYFLNDSEGKLLRKFDYSSYPLSDYELKIRKDRDLFIHIKNGNKRFIITNHPRGTPILIRDQIVKIINNNIIDNSITLPSHLL